MICKDIGCSNKVIELVDNLEWDYVPRLLKDNNFEALIPIYCDMRMAPNGIMPLISRMEELKTRDHDAKNMNELAQEGVRLEKELQDQVATNLNKITNSQIDERTNSIRSFDI